MEIKITGDQAFNFLVDLKKRDLNPIDVAQLIQQYLDASKLSQRALAKQIGMPHSTLQDKLSYIKITKKEYTTLEHNGYSKKEIYRLVRDKRNETKNRIQDALNDPEINLVLKRSIAELNRCINDSDHNPETFDLLKDLRNLTNTLQFRIEKSEKTK